MEFVLIILVVAVVTALLVWKMKGSMRARSKELRGHFRSEYDRQRERRGLREAERELIERSERVHNYSTHPLNQAQYERFLNRWRLVQESFVDDPAATTLEADRLVKEVMVARGYPMADFEQRAADISVDHPRFVTNYREARAVAEAVRAGNATTEDLRSAFVQYRELFDELLVLHQPRADGVSVSQHHHARI